MVGFSSEVPWRVTDWRFTVGVVTGGHFLSHFYKLAFPPLFPLLALEFGLSNVELGLLITAGGVGSFLQAPIGVFVDRFGGKRLFLFAVGMTSLGIILGGVATTYYALLTFTLLSGLGQAAFHPADYSLLDAATTDHREGKIFGVHSFGGRAGSAIAPLVIGVIGFVHGWRMALLTTGAIGLAYVAFAAIWMDPVHRRTVDLSATRGVGISRGLRELATGLFQPTILGMALFFGILGMANNGVQSFAPVLSIQQFRLDAGTANVTLTAYLGAAAVSVLIGGVLVDRYNPSRLIIIWATGAAVLTWGILTGFIAVSPSVAVAFFLVLGLLAGLIQPARDQLVNAVSSKESTGTSFGLAFTGGTVGGTLSPVLLGAVIDAGSPRLAFFLIGGFFLCVALVIAILGITLGPWRSRSW